MDEYLGEIENSTETTMDNLFPKVNAMLHTTSSPLVGMTVLESDGLPPDTTEDTLSEPISPVVKEMYSCTGNFNIKVKRYRLKK